MRRSFPLGRRYSSITINTPIVRIDNGTFYRSYPLPGEAEASCNLPMFSGLTFNLPAHLVERQHWAVIGPSRAGKTAFLEVLRGQHVCVPPTARSFPYLSSNHVNQRYKSSLRALHYAGFDGEQGGASKGGTRGAYLSARYESRREETDFSVLDYLKNTTELNPSEEKLGKETNEENLEKVISDLNLEALVEMHMGNLSNGQMRRARIARALLGRPLVLLLDEPFMGLDPPTVSHLSTLLNGMAEAGAPQLVLALRPQDPLPAWITHVVRLGAPLKIESLGKSDGPTQQDAQPQKLAARPKVNSLATAAGQRGLPLHESLIKARYLEVKRPVNREGLPMNQHSRRDHFRREEVIVSMKGVHVAYGEKIVLGDWRQDTPIACEESSTSMGTGFWWDIRRGDRWGIFGPNGSGKTTLISLLCSDHPQAYSQPIEIFGRTRLPRTGLPGISIFDIQSKIGHSSPEIHAFFPRNLSIRQTLESAWADTFLGTPRLTIEIDDVVDATLRWFEPDLNPAFDPSTTLLVPGQKAHDRKIPQPRRTDWADEIPFGQAPFSAQRVALFLRAIIKQPDIVVLDEAFSGMDEYVRDKCMLFLTWGETKSFAISTTKEPERRWVVPTPPYLLAGHNFTVTGICKKQALICVSHVKEEVPGVVKHWICLPEVGSAHPPRSGALKRPLNADEETWKEIWSL